MGLVRLFSLVDSNPESQYPAAYESIDMMLLIEETLESFTGALRESGGSFLEMLKIS